MASGQKRVAVIDIGSNSTRLLVADVAAGGEITEIERRSTVTRLGRGVDLSGALSVEAIEVVCRTIESYIAIYTEHGATAVNAIATSAVRDAANGGAFIAELRERFNLTARIIDGEQEAQLTYEGATAAHLPTEPTLVVDIGGGSTELIVGSGDTVSFHTSLQAGVVRHTERHLVGDPANTPQLEALAADIRHLVDVALESRPQAQAVAGIGVAGTPTSLAAIDLELRTYDPDRVHGHTLNLGQIQRMLAQLAGLPLERRAEVTGLHPDRAPTIVAGVIILIEVMRAFDLDRITVSEHDILYGAALAAANPEPATGARQEER